jgi:primosomal protein N' (replication factor Y)
MVARVILEIALWKDFDYLIPPEFENLISVGSRVKVPFGNRVVYGFVTEIIEKSSVPNLKPILRVIGKEGTITASVLKLARWIADYYCCAPEVALKSIVPSAVRRDKEGWQKQLFVRLAPKGMDDFKLTRRQMEILALIEEYKEISLARLIELANTTISTIRKLEDKGLIEISPQRIERDPYENEIILPTKPLELNPAQMEAYKQITSAIDCEYAKIMPGENLPISGSLKPAPVFLLHGVTGSGKTEVYLQVIAHALRKGKGAIVLVPEISLTPQTVERFKARFSQGELKTSVAVLHSHLSAGERHDQWHRVREGKAKIVIGARSAIFAPVEPLGLIIVDEEHEQSYKQEEMPCYNARDVAVVRGQMEGAVVVLSSATPSMESYYNAQRGKYILLKLPERVDNKKMPIIRVIDLRSAGHPERGVPIFSPQLREAILQRLERKEQIILFLNRRGYSTHLQCPRCGYVAKCVNCSVSMIYHRQYEKLICHICGNEETVPRQCPNEKCKSTEIRYAGFGTQKIEEILKKHFPHAVVARMDSDTMKKKDDYRKILTEFRLGKIDILVGTQMIAKGLHFPKVTLVGIIYADIALHIPDFRAGERTFQLVTQVAGRAGRGDVEGEVFVQSFTPYHPAIQFARRHDYEGFFEEELRFRSQLKYPPVSRVALLTFRSRNEEKVKLFSNYFKEQLMKALGIDEDLQKNLIVQSSTDTSGRINTGKLKFDDLIIAGPAPAAILKAHSFYRYQIMLRTRRIAHLSRELAKLVKEIKPLEGVYINIDIDPVSID